MKFGCQLANVEKPNSSKKNVVFFRQRTRINMLTVTMPYKQQLDELVESQ